MAEKSFMESLRVPGFCPVCKGLMVGKSTNTWYDNGCCINCFIYFIEGRPEKWKTGWRPAQDEIDNMNKSLGRFKF
jgi:hypothetical protein